MQRSMSWSNCGQIQFIDGNAWALTLNLKSIVIGDEDKIRDCLTTKEIPPDLNEQQNEVWEYILEYRKENGFYGNQSEIKRTSNFRNRPARNFEHRIETSKRDAPAKRIPVCKVKFTQPSLPFERCGGMDNET
jgi:hypothetical protein